MLLEENGYEVREATSGDEGLKLFFFARRGCSNSRLPDARYERGRGCYENEAR